MELKFDYSLDSLNQIGMMKKWPDFWQQAFDKDIPTVKNKEITKIVFLGMGGSAIAGNFVSSVFEGNGIDFIVHKSYGLPKTRLENSLVIASSYSGNTEETLSGVVESIDKNLPIIALSTGGKLKEISVKHNIPFISLPEGLAPRASLAAMLPIIGRITQEIVEGPIEFRKKFSEILETISKKQPTNFVKSMIISLKDKFPIILGAEHTSVVGLRFRAQLNENSKKHAFSFELPEHNHNAIVPIGNDFNDLTYHVLITDRKRLPDRITYRFEFLEKMLKEKSLPYIVLNLNESGTKLEAMLELTYELDFASIFLALLRGIDPNPVNTISALKSFLASK